jgi:hypothetical protein
MKKNSYLALLTGTALTLALVGCDVDQTQEGKMPDVDVTEGQLPEYDVDTPDVDVEMEKEVIEVPDVDVDMPKDD